MSRTALPVFVTLGLTATAVAQSFKIAFIGDQLGRCPCIADVDGDETVGVADFLILLAMWGRCPDPSLTPR